MAWARTVAVVVPSPATSEVLLATSRTIWAPMFSSESLSSISLATVTPSLVMVGEPNFFSMTTLRPLGPRVTFTASAKRLTPRRIACRDSSPCTICFAIILFSSRNFLAQDTPAEMDVRVALICFVRFAHGTRGRSLRSFARAKAALAQDDNSSDDNKRQLAPRSGELFLGGAGQDSEDFFFAHDDEIFTIEFDFGAGILAEQDAVAFFYRQREYLA